MAELKILVCGDVNGNFRSLFSKVSSIVKKKGSFEYLFCVGNFFGTNAAELKDLKSGLIEVPVETYVLGADEQYENFPVTDIAPNISWLGKKGYLKGSSGLNVAYLSGIENLNDAQTSQHNKKSDGSITKRSIFTEDDLKNMINNLKSDDVVDILLTSQWPKGIEAYAVPMDDKKSLSSECSSVLVSVLAKALKPRFHFSGLAGFFYERVPFRNSGVMSGDSHSVTRFIGLAPVSPVFQNKNKWLYALNITPACCLTKNVQKPPVGPVTSSPYDFLDSFSLESDSQQFFYADTSSSSKKRESSDNPQKQSKKVCDIDSRQCWFCLSNSDVEKKLFVLIGDHCYLTIAKGTLVPEHVLIIPIKHIVSSVELPPTVSEEIEKIKTALVRYFSEKGKDVVFFERNYLSAHLQLQAVPVPKNLNYALKDELFSAAKNYELEFIELPDYTNIEQIVSSGKSYFYMELIFDRKSEAKFLHVIKKKFPLQFGRIVLASPKILNASDRIDWRACENAAEEGKMAEKMRKSFSPYFMLEKENNS